MKYTVNIPDSLDTRLKESYGIDIQHLLNEFFENGGKGCDLLEDAADEAAEEAWLAATDEDE